MTTEKQEHIPRAIEVGFPIVEINRLAVPERNSFKPIFDSPMKETDSAGNEFYRAGFNLT